MSKRFWAIAEVTPAAEGWGVALDGKPVRLPTGDVLRLHHAALAEAVAAEWQQAGGAVGGSFSSVDVKLTGLAGAAQTQVRPRPAEVAAGLAAYAEADLLCYRVAAPADLAASQAAAWQPWLDWGEQVHGIALQVTTGIAHVPQPAASLGAARRALDARATEQLAALGVIVPALGSCVLGLALADGAVEVEAAMRLAELDALHQSARWGEDAQAAARRRAVTADVAAAVRFMELSCPGQRARATR